MPEIKMSELEKIGWRYGLIKVSIDDEGTEFEEQINRLVELYPDENGNYTAFCDARLMTLEELGFALEDIKTDGINEYFFNNGKFNWDICENCYTSKLDWESSSKTLGTTAIKENDKGETYLELTADILSQMGWDTGDDVSLDCNSDGTFTLAKISKKAMAPAQTNKNSDVDEELYAIYGGE
jgi:hypothetical protein